MKHRRAAAVSRGTTEEKARVPAAPKPNRRLKGSEPDPRTLADLAIVWAKTGPDGGAETQPASIAT